MNKFERVSAKLQIYFQTHVFYFFKQKNAIWKKYIYACFALSGPIDIIASNESLDVPVTKSRNKKIIANLQKQ